jgi:hypothetical protein
MPERSGIHIFTSDMSGVGIPQLLSPLSLSLYTLDTTVIWLAQSTTGKRGTEAFASVFVSFSLYLKERQ